MQSKMTLSRAAIALVALGALVGGTHCALCKGIACNGGLQWSAGPADGGALEPGTYVLRIDLDGSAYEIPCEVAGELQTSQCAAPELVDGEDSFYVGAEPAHGGEDLGNAADPVRLLMVHAADLREQDDGDRDGSIRGPEEVAVELRLGDRVLVEWFERVEYTRDDEYWGHEACGYCDLLEERSATWTR